MRSKEVCFHLQNVLDGTPWYGKSILSTLSDGSYSLKVLQLLQHMIAWRNLTINKINGDPNNINLDSKEDWPNDPNFNLRIGKEQMTTTTKKLIDQISHKEDGWYRTEVPGSEYNYQFLIEGLIQHDIYHLGQIALLSKGIADE